VSASEPPAGTNGSEANEGLLVRAARALASDVALIGVALARYRALTGWDEAALAAWLGVDGTMLDGLALCARPDRASPSFHADVAAIAQATGCSRDRLLALLIATADTPPDR
jgi:hypothetical protein